VGGGEGRRQLKPAEAWQLREPIWISDEEPWRSWLLLLSSSTLSLWSSSSRRRRRRITPIFHRSQQPHLWFLWAFSNCPNGPFTLSTPGSASFFSQSLHLSIPILFCYTHLLPIHVMCISFHLVLVTNMKSWWSSSSSLCSSDYSQVFKNCCNDQKRGIWLMRFDDRFLELKIIEVIGFVMTIIIIILSLEKLEELKLNRFCANHGRCVWGNSTSAMRGAWTFSACGGGERVVKGSWSGKTNWVVFEVAKNEKENNPSHAQCINSSVATEEESTCMRNWVQTYHGGCNLKCQTL